MAESKKVVISPEAAAAVARGDLIAAIKLVRDANGKIELRLAKEAVEAWRDSRPLPGKATATTVSAAGTHGGLPAAALLALSQGKTIEAIKVLHQSGLDLRTAKERVEAHLHAHAKTGTVARPNNAASARASTVAVRTPTVQQDDSDRRVVVYALLAVVLAVILYAWDAGWF